MFYDEKGLSADVRDQSMKTKHKYVLYALCQFVVSHDMSRTGHYQPVCFYV